MDMTSRVGKEARVAMEIAVEDFNTKTQTNMTLYTRNSKGKVVQAIQDAINLINTYKVEAILGLQNLEEVLSVGEIGSNAQIPTLSLLDSVPQWALDRLPFLVQASPSQVAQMKAFVAIMESCGWNQFTLIYEDINSASIQVIPHLMEAIKESSVQMSNIINLSPLTSSSFLEQLERIKSQQCRVFLVHTSLETGISLFQSAQNMSMMESGYVWITTNLITDLLHTANPSTFLTMEGVVGLGSFFPDRGSWFLDFSTKFQTKFKIEQPEEENNMPGIFAVQAYDATWIAALTLSEKNTSGQNFMDAVSSQSFAGISGEVRFINRKPAASHVFHIINVVGKYYGQLGFWSEGLGFSEVVNDRATYNNSLQNLGHIFWPGRPLHTPTGGVVPSTVNPLRVGVPVMAMFKKFVEVKYDNRLHKYTYTGYSIELFKETVRRLPYYVPYEFHHFNGTYDSLVEQVYLKNFDAVVGDVSVVSWRYQYAEFTHPYTETGLVMIVPVSPYHGQWLFVKPFTLGMWALTIIVNIYCGFVVWLIERNNSPELQGSSLNQTGVLFCLVFTRMFYTNVENVNSNLTRVTTVAWLFAAIIIGQCYTASLTSMLTVRRLIPKVTDCETLKNSNAIVGYDKGSQVGSYLVDVLGFKHENIRSFTSPEEYVHALGNKEIAAVFLAAPYAKLFLSKYCKRFTTAGTTYAEGGFAFAFSKGSPMLPDFTKALLNVSESGTLREIEKRMLGSEHCVDQEAIQDEYERLGLGSFWSLFLLAGGTSTVALAIYVIQNLCQLERSLVTIISDARKFCVHRRKRLSRKVSDVESAESPNAQEIT
ncbi:glutamate receptor 2.8 [Helianthus annuus]|nr:glutamate receptor 2.8 [Helianthus annuus]